MMRICCLLLLLSAGFAASARSYDPGELQDEVSFLSGDRFQGRLYGSAGNRGAAVYIGDMLLRAGLDIRTQSDRRKGFNVIGRIPASVDGAEDIIISAYYDGVGRNATGEICPGADANVSGVVALLELARAFSESPLRSYNLIFVAIDGHNAGLSGGKAFAGSYYGEARLMITLDTMGSTFSPVPTVRSDYLLALGAAPWRGTLERVNRRTAMLDLHYDYFGSPSFTRFFYVMKSDHKYMLDLGVPCVMFTSGITMHTNHPSDTAETLDYGVFARRILLIESWLRTFEKKNIN